jgi:hypothetical protein
VAQERESELQMGTVVFPLHTFCAICVALALALSGFSARGTVPQTCSVIFSFVGAWDRATYRAGNNHL